MAKISVIIPVYNVEKYLSQCLDSVINQTFNDIEIICINDGSTDSSLSIIEEYAQKDNRIKVINKENGGLSSARNAGLDNITGEYVYFLDSDDYIESNVLERAIDIFTKNDIDYYCFGSKAFQEDKCIQSLERMNNYLKIKRNGCFNLTFKIGFNTNIHVWNKVFKASLIKKHNIRFKDKLLYEDIYFMWYYFFVSHKAYFDNEIYHHYRMCSTSIMEETTSNKNFNTGIHHLYNWHELFISLSANNEFIQKHFDELFYLLKFYTKSTLSMVPHKDKKEVLKLKEQYKNEMFRLCPKKKFIYLAEQLFSIKKSIAGEYKTLTICGIKLKIRDNTKKMLVHLHIYYHEQIDFFLNHLSNIVDCDFDLFVTLIENKQETIEKILNFKSDTKIFKINNIGYDIYPFIYILRKVNLNNYDYIMKLHTKNYQNKEPYWHGKGWQWRNILVNSLIGSKKTFKKCLKTLQNKKIGVIGAKQTLVYMGQQAPEDTYLYDKICNQYKLSKKRGHFIAGSMFIAKAGAMQLIKDLPCEEIDFKKSGHTGDSATLAHVIERFLGVLVEQQGYLLYGKSLSLMLYQKD